MDTAQSAAALLEEAFKPDAPVSKKAELWLLLDQDPETRKEIEALVAEKSENELAKRLGERMAFGTAGLRAEMGAGFARMNNLTVIQATQGLCQYLLASDPDVASRGVVIGHDHRHHSDSFARLAAAVFLSKGIRVWYYRDLVHTPLVPYGVKVLKAACGIMITASHNPKQYNGYKVYASNGCQIISPFDEYVADAISKNQIPWIWDPELINKSPDFCIDPLHSWDGGAGVLDRYLKEVSRLSSSKVPSEKQIPIVYSAMHGVGSPYAARAFKAFSLNPFHTVQEQDAPHPDFPTVKFPNPEEGAGALKLSTEHAEKIGSSVILANDPDADRLAVAEKVGSQWKIFTGNEIGVVLASYVWENYVARHPDEPRDKLVMLCSTVSSKMLGRIAEVEGFRFEDTLTGFKWLGNHAINHEKAGRKALFAYEEAIGFMVGDVVKDKDGVSAAAVFAEMANHLYLNGSTIFQRLESLYDRYGYFLADNSYYICYSAETINRLFNKIRYGVEIPEKDASPSFSSKVGSSTVLWVRDLTIGYDSRTADKRPTLPVSSGGNMITLGFLEGNTVATIRTSGTEPKIKYYIEACGSNNSREVVAATLRGVVRDIVEHLLEPVKFGLIARSSS